MGQDDVGTVSGDSPLMSDALEAIEAITASALDAGQLVAVAVTDRAGDLVALGRMDGSERRWVRHAQRKAYTAAIMGRSTTSLAAQMRKRDVSIVEYGDPQLTSLPGGVPLLNRPGQAYAGVGVAGNGGPERDNELAELGARLLRAHREANGSADRA
jgi:glc operon protein GlcG